jgi:hypothetical protein
MNYCRTARIYQLLESLFIGPSLLQARVAQLSQLGRRAAPIQHALLVGEGNGSFLLPFVRRFPKTRITVIDQSAAMLRIGQSRLAAAGLLSAEIEFIVADVTTLRLPERRYDLLVTQFFFDNFSTSQVQQIIAQLEQASRANAHWLLADYCLPGNGWRAWRAKIWLRLLYSFFGLVADVPARALPEIEAAIAATSFQCIDRRSLCGAMLFSACYTRRYRTAPNSVAAS